MSIDILEMSGHLALGSRLKRLAERMQADAGRAHAAMGFPMQPSQFSLLSALDRFGPQARLCVLPEGPQTIPYVVRDDT